MTTLKRSMSEAGACQDLSHGLSGTTLYDLLADLAKGGAFRFDVRQATIATGVLGEFISPPFPIKVKRVSQRVGVAGSAGATTVQLRVAGSNVLAVTTDNTATDPSLQHVVPGQSGVAEVVIPANSLVDVNVSAAPTGGTGLVYSVQFSSLDIEP